MNYKKLSKLIFKNKRLVEIGSIIALLLIASAFKFSADYLEKFSKGGKFATLALSFNTGERIFEGEVYENMTVLDALNAAMKVGEIELVYYIDEAGQTQIYGINGHQNGIDGKFFTFFLNSKRLNPLKLNKIDIEPGDNIVIKFEEK